MRESMPGVTAGVFLAVSMMVSCPVAAQAPYTTSEGEMMLFESAGAARLVEQVRSKTQGVMVEIFVKEGDAVKKGQVLGHAELDATKLQLDLARENANSSAKFDAAESQAEAWTIAREEVQEAVRKRDVSESRLDWALAMERMYKAQLEAQKDALKTQRIQLEYWEQQYENRFFRAPVAGTVSEVKVELGRAAQFRGPCLHGERRGHLHAPGERSLTAHEKRGS